MALVHSEKYNRGNNQNSQLTLHSISSAASGSSSLAPNLLGPRHSKFTLSTTAAGGNNIRRNNTTTIEPIIITTTTYSSCTAKNGGRFIASADLDGKVSLWCCMATTTTTTAAANGPHQFSPSSSSMKTAENEDAAAAGTSSTTTTGHHHQSAAATSTTCLKPRHPKLEATYNLKCPVTRVKFAGGDTLLVCAQANGLISIVDIESGQVSRTIHQPSSAVASSNCSNNNNNNTSAAASFENAVVINDIAVSPHHHNDTIFASCGDDGRICVFDLRISGKSAGCSRGFYAMMASSSSSKMKQAIPQTAIAFGKSSQDSLHLFAGGLDGNLRWLQRTGLNDIKCLVECPDAHDDVISGIDTLPSSSSSSSYPSSSTAAAAGAINGDASKMGIVLSYSVCGTLRIHDLRPWSGDDKHILFEDDHRKLLSDSSSSSVTQKQQIDKSLLRCCFSPTGDSIAVATFFGGGVALYQNVSLLLKKSYSVLSQQQQQQQNSGHHNSRNAINSLCEDYFRDNRFFVNPHAQTGTTITDLCFHPKSNLANSPFEAEQVLLTSSVDGTCVVAAV